MKPVAFRRSGSSSGSWPRPAKRAVMAMSGRRSSPQLPEGRVRLGYKRRYARPVLTLFGEVRITRMGYGAPGRQAIYPLDRELGLPGRIYSYECQRRLMRAVVCSPFDEAISFVAEMTGVTVPKRAAEQLVREAAVDFEDFYVQRPAAEVKPAHGEILVAAIDCKGIPMVKPERALRVVRRDKGQKANKKRMATVAAMHNQAPIVRTPQQVLDSLFGTVQPPKREPRARPSHKRVWASLTADKDTFINDINAEMQRHDAGRQHTRGDRHRRQAGAAASRGQDLQRHHPHPGRSSSSSTTTARSATSASPSTTRRASRRCLSTSPPSAARPRRARSTLQRAGRSPSPAD